MTNKDASHHDRQECLSYSSPLTLEGHRIVVREQGAGEPVILVHGWNGSSYDWTKLMPLIARRRRAIAPDQLGFGRSDKPRIDYRLSLFVRLIDGLADALGLERFHLVGNSMGGHIAAAYALERPDRLDSLALLDAAGTRQGAPFIFKLGRFEWANRAVFSRLGLRLFDFYYRRFGPYHDSSFLTPLDVKEHYHSYGRPDAAYASAQCLRHIVTDPRAQLDGRLGELRVATLVVWGRQDPLLPLRMGRAFQAAIPHARLQLLERCGHCPQEEKPAELAGLLEGFWDQQSK